MQQIEQVTTIIAHPHGLIHLPIKYFAPTSGRRTQFLPFAFPSITFRGTQFHRSKQFKSLFLFPPRGRKLLMRKWQLLLRPKSYCIMRALWTDEVNYVVIVGFSNHQEKDPWSYKEMRKKVASSRLETLSQLAPPVSFIHIRSDNNLKFRSYITIFYILK